MLPLCFAQPGEPVIIKRIGGTPDVRQHLENLGFIVKVKECRIAVSDELARKIMV